MWEKIQKILVKIVIIIIVGSLIIYFISSIYSWWKKPAPLTEMEELTIKIDKIYDALYPMRKNTYGTYEKVDVIDVIESGLNEIESRFDKTNSKVDAINDTVIEIDSKINGMME